MCSFQVLRLLHPGSEVSPIGNIDSRVTDGVILHIYTLKLSVHVFCIFVSMCVSCSLCVVQP